MRELYHKAVNHHPVKPVWHGCRVRDVNSAQTIQQVNTPWIKAGDFKVKPNIMWHQNFIISAFSAQTNKADYNIKIRK